MRKLNRLAQGMRAFHRVDPAWPIRLIALYFLLGAVWDMGFCTLFGYAKHLFEGHISLAIGGFLAIVID